MGFPPKSSHFNRLFHYFHHPFWGKIPLCLVQHPYMLVPFRDHPGADFLRPPTPRRHSLVEEVSAAPYVPPFRSSELPVLEKIPAFFGGRNLMEPKKKRCHSKSGPNFWNVASPPMTGSYEAMALVSLVLPPTKKEIHVPLLLPERMTHPFWPKKNGWKWVSPDAGKTKKGWRKSRLK